jgi:hypothetical protein
MIIIMPGKIIVLDELNKELYYESNFYDKIIEEIVSQLANFIRYNPDDLNKEVLKKIVARGFSKTPHKIIGPLHLKGEDMISIHLRF